MDYESQAYTNLLHGGLIPQKYHRAAGFAGYEFLIARPRREVFHTYFTSQKELRSVPASAAFALHGKVGLQYYLIAVEADIALFAAIILMGQLLVTTNRVEKYLLLFRAYEGLFPRQDVTLAAIRHSLAHAPTRLTKKATQDALGRLFGTLTINLDNSKHYRQFYIHLGKMFLLVDGEAHRRAAAALQHCVHLCGEQCLAYPWDSAHGAV